MALAHVESASSDPASHVIPSASNTVHVEVTDATNVRPNLSHEHSTGDTKREET